MTKGSPSTHIGKRQALIQVLCSCSLLSLSARAPLRMNQDSAITCPADPTYL